MNELETKSVSKFCDKLVKISTIGDGNCLIHCILKAACPEYQENTSRNFRCQYASEIRKNLSEAILLPDSRYETDESVCNLIRIEYKTETPKHFMEFLRTMYKYESSYIRHPEPPIPFNHNVNSYREYIIKYKDYVLEFYNKIKEHKKEEVKAPVLEKYEGEKQELTLEDLKEFDLISRAYWELENIVTYEINKLKYDLEVKLGMHLYLPNRFNENVIEAILENKTVPTGRYESYPNNCYLFTSCKGSNLMKFEWEYCNIPDIVCLKDIHKHLKSDEFIGEMDALPYIPELMDINLIILNFDSNRIINVYQNEANSKFILIHNRENIHFELVGLKQENLIETIFDRNHPFIQEALNSLNKEISYECFKEKPITINFIKNEFSGAEKPRDIVVLLRNLLGDSADVEYYNDGTSVAYVRYKQTPKTIYRFYVNSKGEITSGSLPEKLKVKIQRFFNSLSL